MVIYIKCLNSNPVLLSSTWPPDHHDCRPRSLRRMAGAAGDPAGPSRKNVSAVLYRCTHLERISMRQASLKSFRSSHVRYEGCCREGPRLAAFPGSQPGGPGFLVRLHSMLDICSISSWITSRTHIYMYTYHRYICLCVFGTCVYIRAICM